MDDVDLLESVLTKTGDLIAGVDEDQWGLPTPCPDFDVRALVNHLVGWIRTFDAGRHGRDADEDPAAYRAGEDPAAEFRAAATSLVAGWREHGLAAPARGSGAERPGEMVFTVTVTVIEYLTHGWDLAVATGQALPFSDEESLAALARAQVTLLPQYRGEGMPFGEVVEVEPDATATQRLVAFLGRRPGWD